VARSPTITHTRTRFALALTLLLAAGCGRGCGARTPAPDRLLSSLPAGTRFIVSIDVARIRASSLWSRVAALAEEAPEDKQRLARLTQRTGLDPLRQIHRIVAAFPDNARAQGTFALIIEGQGFDEERLVAFAREDSGAKLEARARGRRRLWSSGAGRPAAFFDGTTRVVLGAGAWADTMADLADGVPGVRSAADDLELVHLVARAQPGRALWFAALVPLDVRQALMADPHLDSAGSVTRLAASVDLGPGLAAELVADLSNAADARTLEGRIATTVRESKRNAKLLMLGLGPYLDALEAHADGPSLRVKLVLGEPQTKDLLERLSGFLRLARKRAPP
jgi:hypothetical protein